jgi:hypothetical protein
VIPRNARRLRVQAWMWMLVAGVLAACGQSAMTDSPPAIDPTQLDDGPTEVVIYMRDQSVLVIGWEIASGQRVEARGAVSQQPSARCILVPADWALRLWRARDIIDRPDPLAEGGAALTSGEVIADGHVTLAIDVDVSGNPGVIVDRAPEWWRGPDPDCP